MARIKNTGTPFGIDFGVGDVIVPKQEPLSKHSSSSVMLGMLGKHE